MKTSFERLAAKEKVAREERYATRKLLDKNYAAAMQSRFAITKAEKTPYLSGPLTIEALGSSYPLQKRKLQEADMRQTMHNLSVEGLMKETSLTELTQEKMTASPVVHKMPTKADMLAEKRQKIMQTKLAYDE